MMFLEYLDECERGMDLMTSTHPSNGTHSCVCAVSSKIDIKEMYEDDEDDKPVTNNSCEYVA